MVGSLFLGFFDWPFINKELRSKIRYSAENDVRFTRPLLKGEHPSHDLAGRYGHCHVLESFSVAVVVTAFENIPSNF